MLPVTVLLMAIGYTAVLLGLIVPPATDATAWVLARLGDFTVQIVQRVDEWPGATVYLPRLSWAWTVLATVCVVYWLGWAHRRDRRAWLLTIACAAWLALICTFGVRLPARTAVRLDVLAMGAGSARRGCAW